ncbi:hypothetical protein [Lactococcus lactis]|uniref:hypothetical protein n=1 Tax=Lactococcus lactis TaxID=1358 RepID=UPI00071E31A9|nr:hypothetical protein [Lactococcus lactis]
MKIELSDWKHMTYEQLENKYNISREQIYKIILDQKLYLHRSVIERYRFSELEHLYILKSNNLSISQLANMFHKSYNAMLMQIKAKGYYDRIKYRK